MWNRANGTPVTPDVYAATGNTPGYRMMGMHVDLADKFANNAVDPWRNPKPYTFREGWSGNMADVTADTHNIRATLYELDRLHPGSIPRQWFTTPQDYEAYVAGGGFRPDTPMNVGAIKDTLGSVTVNKVPRQTEYGVMADPWYRAAEQLGIHPAEAQSGGWFSYGPITGLRSPPKTIPQLLDDQIGHTGNILGVDPRKILEWWGQKKIPLAGLGGGAVADQLYNAGGGSPSDVA
jgi:hypothetical protein